MFLQNDPQTQPNLTNKMSARPSAYRSRDEMEIMLSSKPDFSASQMCSQTQPQTSNLPCFNTSTPAYKISNVPSVRQLEGTQQETPMRQFRVIQQCGKENKVERPQHSIIAPSSHRMYPTNSVLNQKSADNGNLQYRPMETLSRTMQLNSHTPLNVNRPSNCLSNPLQVSQVSSTLNSRIICGKSCISNDQTPNHGHFVPETGNKGTDSSVARTLFPQFKPKKMLSQFTNAVNPVDQAPKIKPTFGVQKTSSTRVERMSSILQVTAKAAPSPFSYSVKDKPSMVNAPSSVYFLNIPSSQPSQQPTKKIPLFFKKNLAEQKPLAEKQVSVSQKSAGVKKTKLASANKDGKEKAAKGVKRSIKVSAVLFKLHTTISKY